MSVKIVDSHNICMCTKIAQCTNITYGCSNTYKRAKPCMKFIQCTAITYFVHKDFLLFPTAIGADLASGTQDMSYETIPPTEQVMVC